MEHGLPERDGQPASQSQAETMDGAPPVPGRNPDTPPATPDQPPASENRFRTPAGSNEPQRSVSKAAPVYSEFGLSVPEWHPASGKASPAKQEPEVPQRQMTEGEIVATSQLPASTHRVGAPGKPAASPERGGGADPQDGEARPASENRPEGGASSKSGRGSG